MNILPRQSLFLWVCSLVLVSVLIGMLISTPVWADVGEHPIVPGGSSIAPEEETPIQMVAEIVVMNVRSATAADKAVIKLYPEGFDLTSFPAIAEVAADFTMKNPTSDVVSMTAWFPLASALENANWEGGTPGGFVRRIESFQVSVDGNPVEYAVSELPNPQGADMLPLPWASFPVTFLAGKETLIHVSYLLPLQRAIGGNELALYYIFQTGASWAGPIGQAELVLNLPYPASTETLARKPSGSLSVPYPMSGSPGGVVPLDAVLEGNQARWTWKEFEPGAEDDFSIWLMGLSKWQELETARAAVRTNPEDGQAWLNLAVIYTSLSIQYYQPAIFSASYLPLGIEAYQKAADLLPEHPTPHIGLALLSLLPYMIDKNAPPEVIQFVQDEFQLARELGDIDTFTEEAGGFVWFMLEEALWYYAYNDATVTAEWNDLGTERAKKTVDAALLSATPTRIPTLTATPTRKPTLTVTPIRATIPPPTTLLATAETPTATPISSTTPPPTTPPTTTETTGDGQSQVIIVAAGVIGLVVAGYLAWKRWRKSAGA